MGVAKLKESGDYDDATTQAVAAFQEKAGIGYSSGNWDATTAAAINQIIKSPKSIITIPSTGAKYQVTKAEMEQLKGAAFPKAAKAIEQNYVNMANEAKNYWDAHDKCRKTNWFWGNAIELATGAKFPDASVIDNAVKAANSMKVDAGQGKLNPKMLESRSAPIRNAFAAMDQYRETMFDGGEKLAQNCQTIADGCVIVLEISAAVATGGASWQIQVGVAAGLGGYKELLVQVSQASTDPKVTIDSAALSVFKAALIDGSVEFIMKGNGKGLENVAEKIAEDACKQAALSGSKVAIKQYLIKAIAAGSAKIAEEVVKGMGKLLTDPKAKLTPDDFVKASVEVVVKAFAVGIIGPSADKWMKTPSTKIDPKLFDKILGDVKFDKALASGLKKAIEAAAGGAVKKTLDGWDPKKDPGTFDDEVQKAIVNDKNVQAAAKKAAAETTK